MKLIIHRGAHEIGGSCVEIKADTTRLIIDIGMPLFYEHNPEKKFDSRIMRGKSPQELLATGILPRVDGLYEGIESNGKIDGLVLSHSHQDHYGLTRYVKKDIPVYLGEAALEIIKVTEMFITHGYDTIKCPKIIDIRNRYNIGDISITPYLMDHSAFDAFGLLIEGDGKSIFYSGDFRGHGRKKGSFEWFLKHGPNDVDCLLMEGTMLGRYNSEYITESDLERIIIEKIKGCENVVFGWFSSQNIDRLVTFFRAAKQTGRTFVIDLYTAYLLHRLSKVDRGSNIPNADWDAVRVFYPKRVMTNLYRHKNQDEVIPLFRKQEISLDEISKNRSKIIMMFRDSMWDEVKTMASLNGSMMIYSQFEGYLKEGRYHELLREIKEMGIQFETLHTSGHAFINDLQRYCSALNPKVLVPIHSFHAGEYEEVFKDHLVHILKDGEELTL